MPKPFQENCAKKAAREMSERIDAIVLKWWSDEEKRWSDALSDADFVRRRWIDLTGKLPSPADLDHFLKSKDPSKREKLVKELLERDDVAELWAQYFSIIREAKAGLGALQKKFYTELLAATDRGDVARITQVYLDRMIDYVMTNPKNQDVPDAMRQIIFVYESRGKTVEAGAWRDKLLLDHLRTSAEEELLKKAERLARLPTELVAAKRTDGEIVDALYKATLARLPAETEKAFTMKHLQSGKDRTKLCRDLLWALANTKEFMELHSLRAGSDLTTRFLDVLTRTWDR